jgi:hypothetical protein
MKQVSETLGIYWKLQSTSKTEKMNHTLKKYVSQNMSRDKSNMGKGTAYYLFRVRVFPRSRLQLNPYEIVYGRPA